MKNSVLLSAAASAVAFVVACSSGSPAPSSPADDGGATTCQGAGDCMTDEICCISATTQPACVGKSTGCPTTPVGRIQLCAGADECVTPGATCGPAAFHTSPSLKACSSGTAPAADRPLRAADGG